jgi:maleylacetoacetate isomerase
MAPEQFHLHTYFRSSCSARVRIAAAIKGIPLQYTYVHLLKNEQSAPEYIAQKNPLAAVPTLTYTSVSGQQAVITQSVAILEFFEECFPNQHPLLPPPSDVLGRAKVRELVNIIACDVQPPTNLRILNRVKALGGDGPAWANELLFAGLVAFEKLAVSSAGEYSVGNEVTLADVMLSPTVDGALRWGVSLDTLPTVKRIFEKIRDLPEFKKGDWRHQEDTPEEFRVQ